jgi:hypothetical protein
MERSNRVDTYFPVSAIALWVWMVSLKFVKVSEHFRKYPGDIVYFPGYLIFGHIHAFIKAYAFLTMWKKTWATAEHASEMIDEGENEEIKKWVEKAVQKERATVVVDKVEITIVEDKAEGKAYLGFQITKRLS